MTADTKYIIQNMLTKKMYLVKRHGNKRNKAYVLYNNKQMSQAYVSNATVKVIKDVLKVDSKNRITLNLSLVRQQHGKSFIKQEYKKIQHGI